jgi:hypothetical protein
MAMSSPTKVILERAVLAAQTYAESFAEELWLKDRPLLNLHDLFLEGLEAAFLVEGGLLATMPTTLAEVWR